MVYSSNLRTRHGILVLLLSLLFCVISSTFPLFGGPQLFIGDVGMRFAIAKVPSRSPRWFRDGVVRAVRGTLRSSPAPASAPPRSRRFFTCKGSRRGYQGPSTDLMRRTPGARFQTKDGGGAKKGKASVGNELPITGCVSRGWTSFSQSSAFLHYHHHTTLSSAIPSLAPWPDWETP